MKCHQEKAAYLCSRQGILKTKDLEDAGVHRVAIAEMVKHGKLLKLSRGLYVDPAYPLSEESQLAQTAIKYPGAVFCLLTALQIHGITTQLPHEIWIAIQRHHSPPKQSYPPLRVFRTDSIADGFGIEQKTVDGIVQILVTDIHRTIAECFKYRNKLGLNIALEALHEAWAKNLIHMDALQEAAKHLRVTNVMRPYLESLS